MLSCKLGSVSVGVTRAPRAWRSVKQPPKIACLYCVGTSALHDPALLYDGVTKVSKNVVRFGLGFSEFFQKSDKKNNEHLKNILTFENFDSGAVQKCVNIL